MNIFLAGASGFVGDRVLEDLVKAGHHVTALAHSGRSREEIQRKYPNVTIVLGDVAKKAEMSGILPKEIQSVIYLPGLLREFPKKGITFQGTHVEGVRNLLAEADRVGAKRWIQMSAMGAEPNSVGKYYQTKWAAEELVRASKLDWTIIRPSVIFDDRPTKRHNFVSELADVVRKSPVIPVFGDGKYRLQPVSVDDVSQTVVQALEKPETIFHSYDLGGPEQLEYEAILRAIAQAMGKNSPMVHIPFGLVSGVTDLLESFAFYPLTSDQLHMLRDENIVKDSAREAEWRSTFDLPLKRFEDGVRTQLSRS